MRFYDNVIQSSSPDAPIFQDSNRISYHGFSGFGIFFRPGAQASCLPPSACNTARRRWRGGRKFLASVIPVGSFAPPRPQLLTRYKRSHQVNQFHHHSFSTPVTPFCALFVSSEYFFQSNIIHFRIVTFIHWNLSYNTDFIKLCPD
jgi:hypothetical protein